MVPDDSLTIRQRAIAAWPTAWGGQNQRDILVSLGYDVDRPWRDLPKKIAIGFSSPTSSPSSRSMPASRPPKPGEPEAQRGAQLSRHFHRRQALRAAHFCHHSKRVDQKTRFPIYDHTECPLCHGKRLRRESLSVKFAGFDIADMSALPLIRLAGILRPTAEATSGTITKLAAEHPEKAMVAQRIAQDLVGRITVLLDLGLGYLSLERSTPTLSPGELQRLRLATQVRSNLFGVVYVLDEPSAGLHPSDTEALLAALDRLKASGQFALCRRTRS